MPPNKGAEHQSGSRAHEVRPTRASRRSHHELRVRAPYRLDLTATALRRLSTNVVNVLAADGAFLRVLGPPGQRLLVRAAQPRPGALAVTVEGAAAEHQRALDTVRRMLGTERDVSCFTRPARRIGWLAPLAARLRGLKPPRYPTLWEALVNAIVFQQVSLAAASAITRRLIVALERPLEVDGTLLYPFPSVEEFVHAHDADLHGLGLSGGKIGTLRRSAEALLSGTLAESRLEEQPSAEAAASLQRIKGIGPWTAAVILLRGLGRLDVFPLNDTSVARNVRLVAGDVSVDVTATLAMLEPCQGMLYYHLLLGRLQARGEVPGSSAAV